MVVTAESALRSAGASTGPAARWVTELPSNLADAVPLVRVAVIGGNGEDFAAFTNPRIDFDCFDTPREDARDLAYRVRAWVRSLPGQMAGGAFVLRVQNDNEPNWVPYDNTNLRRFVYTAQLRLHT